VPVVPVVVPVVVVVVVCCPHAGNANTKRKVRVANIVRQYGTYLSLLVHIRFACFTLVHRHKSCNL
jgi:fumarate reductase subunit D